MLDPAVLFISHALPVARQIRGRIIVIHTKRGMTVFRRGILNADKRSTFQAD
ncbi:hypothetical protein EDF70_111116 [Neorhizobium sp. JUb45]|nr:hypothetical protein EDF70_111116 [Neorhizobium sp. JUb45]